MHALNAMDVNLLTFFIHLLTSFLVWTLPLLQANKLKELNFKNTLAPICSEYYARTQCYGRQPACFCIHHLRLQRQILCIFLVHLAQNFFLFFHIQSVPGNGFTPCKRLFTYLPTLCNRLMRTIRNLLETIKYAFLAVKLPFLRQPDNHKG